jgi:hypothetical protein
MKKSTPPRPIRPGATSTTTNPKGYGSRKGTDVRKITKVTKPMSKSVARNPDAPKPVGSGTSVKVMTKSETAIKKGQAKGVNTGSKPAPKKLKKVSTQDKMIERMQLMKKKPTKPGTQNNMPSTGRGAGMRGGLGGGIFGTKNR